MLHLRRLHYQAMRIILGTNRKNCTQFMRSKLRPDFHMICNGLRPSEAAWVSCIADDRKHRRQMFPFKSEAIADKRTTNPLQSEEKKERTYCKSHWTCFKANDSVSPKGYRSSQTHVSIKNCLSRKCRNGRESRTRFNFPDHPDRVPQITADRCCHMSAT